MDAADSARPPPTRHAPALHDPEAASLASTSDVGWSAKLRTLGVETRGIFPVPIEKRTDRRLYQIFFIWFSWNFNILSFSAGTLGPLVFGLGLRDSCLVILFFNALGLLLPSYFTTWGPKLGLRQMCQARYTFGYYGVILPSIFNLIGMCGFSVLNCILGGQTLSAVSGGSLSWAVGIVIIAAISLFISFCGIKVVTWYERMAWVPVLISFVVALGVGGKHLSNPTVAAEPATAVAVLSFGSTIAGFVITYSSLSSDYTTYLHHAAPSWKVFAYSFAGFMLPIVPIMCFGAAASVALPGVPAWDAGYAQSNVGGLLLAMLSPAGGFGKFLTVLLSLSVAANVAPTFYSIGLTFQVFCPWTASVPRYLFSLLATAIILPLSIVGAHRFTEALTNFLSLIGYWASCFCAVILLEHFYFRRGDFGAYDLSAWNVPARLPPGLAAIVACVGSFALVVPCMEQTWFTGPIGRHTGDIGFEVAFVLTGALYIPLRTLERRICAR